MTNRPTPGEPETRTASLELAAADKLVRGIVPYGSSAQLNGFTEEIASGALDATDFSRLRATIDHADRGLPLARYPKTITLDHADRGLEWSFSLPESRTDVAEAIERGDIAGSSFRMVVAEDRWTGDHRTITRIAELHDITLAASQQPAYQTVVEYRTIDPAEAEEDNAMAVEADNTTETATAVEATEDRSTGTLRVEDRVTVTGDRDDRPEHPLAFTSDALDKIQGLVEQRDAGRILAGLVEDRAALTTTTYGQRRHWGANVLDGPRLLHVVAGVPQDRGIGAIAAAVPQLTVPAAVAGVAENVSLPEFAASTANNVTLARFGRYTDLSTEARISTDVAPIMGAHRIGIARDLDKVLIDAVETAAGTAVAFTADVPAAIRKALAQVVDNTAASGASDCVVLSHPDNIALLQNVTPTGGMTAAEAFANFSGARTYASSAVDTGFMTVANLRAGARYLEARGQTVETFSDPKTGTYTTATSVVAGYGLTLAGGATGAFIKVDVVTP